MKKTLLLFGISLWVYTLGAAQEKHAQVIGNPAYTRVAPLRNPAHPPAEDSPDWLSELPPEDMIWGIGVAKPSSPAMSRTTAEARARVAIALRLAMMLEEIFPDYNRNRGKNPGAARLSPQETIRRQIIHIQINGASLNKLWTAPDGAVWSRMALSKDNAKTAARGLLEREKAQYRELDVHRAMQLFENPLARTYEPLVVDGQ